MKKIAKWFFYVVFFLGGISISFSSCEFLNDNPDLVDNFLNEFFDVGFGWYGEAEDLTEIEDDINFGNSGTIPSSVDLRSKFPPIGHQGQYGTCVAWSVGYNLRTYLSAVDHNYSTSELASPSKQYSPKDLFWAVDNSEKGADCNGTGFDPAFDVMQSRGIATLSTVPYDELGDCSSSPSSNWTSEAANHKIESYRQIDASVDVMKQYLADGRAIAIGAKLGDNFMSWNTDDVLSYDTDTYNGQHAYHAMVCAGYDDSKGANGAFLIINSWGTDWGGSGYIWVDYDFFVSTFCFAAFVAQSVPGDPEEDEPVEGLDLVSWNLEDVADATYEEPNKRQITYNVYNTGQQTINASSNWSILYLVYNAYDAEDYYILVFDYYTEDYGDNENHYGQIDATDPMAIGEVNWWNNIDIPGGASVASTLIPGAVNFSFDYNIPTYLNGDYYMVLFADGFDNIAEYDESNNYLFFAADGDEPLSIVNGVIQNEPYSKPLSKGAPATMYAQSPKQTLVTERNRNTYRPTEIMQMLQYHQQTGELQRRIDAFISNKGKSVSK